MTYGGAEHFLVGADGVFLHPSFLVVLVLLSVLWTKVQKSFEERSESDERFMNYRPLPQGKTVECGCSKPSAEDGERTWSFRLSHN
jgi:hypothetical protein